MNESLKLEVLNTFLLSTMAALRKGCTQVTLPPDFWEALQEHYSDLTDPVSTEDGCVGRLLSLRVRLGPDGSPIHFESGGSVTSFLQEAIAALQRGCTKATMDPTLWSALQVQRPDLTDPVTRDHGGFVGYILSLQVHLDPNLRQPAFG